MKELKRWAVNIIQEIGDRYRPADGMRLRDLDQCIFYKNAYQELCRYIWNYKMDYRSDDPLKDAIESFLHLAYEGVEKSNSKFSYSIFFAMVEVANDMLEVFRAAE